MKKIIITSMIILLLSALVAYGNLISVPSDYETIQSGINAASDSDTVLVLPGTYVENINFNGKKIVVASLTLTMQDTSFTYMTVIDGNQSGSVVTFSSGEDSCAVLSGFTITNGLAERGGGIYCFTASPTLTNLYVTSNTSTISEGGGGGIYLSEGCNSILTDIIVSNNASSYIGNRLEYDFPVNREAPCLYGGGICIVGFSSPILTNITVTGNLGNWGGGIFCGWASHPIMNNILVSYNMAACTGFRGYGSGICVTEDCNPIINRAKVVNNTIGKGAVYFLDECGGIIKNSIISENQATGISLVFANPLLINNVVTNNRLGISCGGDLPMEIINCTVVGNTGADCPTSGIFTGGSPNYHCLIENCILWENGGYEVYSTSSINVEIAYSDIHGGQNAVGGNCTYNYHDNMDTDPLFMDEDNHDYHLDYISPCIDAGNPESDYSNEPQPNGGRINMGAYGNATEATLSTGITYVADVEAVAHEFSVPIINEFNPVEPINIDLVLSYDADVLDFQGCSSMGTQVENWTIVSEEINPGEITISAFSTDTLNMDSNVLLNLNFLALTNNATTEIDFDSAVFGDITRNTLGGTITIAYTDINLDLGVNTPEKFILHGNYPNPFNPTTTITFGMPQKAEVELKIYDISGKLIKKLIQEEREAGYHSVGWDGKDDAGHDVPSGVYFCRIEGDFQDTKQMLLLK